MSWDIGGLPLPRERSLWAQYLYNGSAVVFVIDSADRERFAEAHKEFWTAVGMMRASSFNIKILLVLANKQDITDAASATES